MEAEPKQAPDAWRTESLASIMEHIVRTHHVYCRREVVEIEALFKDVIAKQGSSHPELKRMHDLFLQMARDLLKHMLKEEETLFPYIARVEEEVSNEVPVSWPPFGTVGNPIRIMVLEHLKTDDEMEQIRRLSNGHAPPVNASEDYRALCQRLADFERDMRQHIECENDILFPRAVAMEEAACAAHKS